MLKVITTVRFLAQGAYQRGVGNENSVSLSQPSVSKVLNEVIDCINLHLLQKYIKFPTSPVEKQIISDWYGFKYSRIIYINSNSLFYRFRTKYQIPGVIGIIDGSQISIFPPATNDNRYPEFIYVNRKGFHSINTQFVSIYF